MVDVDTGVVVVDVDTDVAVVDVESFPSVFSATQSQEEKKPRTLRLTKNRKRNLSNEDPVDSKIKVGY